MLKNHWAHLVEVSGLSIHFGPVLAGFILLLIKYPSYFILGIFLPEITAHQLSDGIANTAFVGVISIILGTAAGIVTAYILRRPYRSLNKFARLSVRISLYFLLSIPVYVMLIFGQSYVINQWSIAISVLGLNLTVFVTKLLLSAFDTMRQEPLWAATGVGATWFQLIREYEWPEMWRVCGAAITNEWATTLKLTSLVGVVGIYDTMNVARNSAQQNYDMRVFWAVILAYAILIMPLLLISDFLDRRS